MRLNDYDIPTDEMELSGDMGINDKDMGGTSSSTASSHQGFEPKLLNVSILITFLEGEIATEIFALAESLEEDGSKTVYSIIDDTAQVMGIQKVEFSSSVGIRKLGNHKQGWRLSFTLREKESVPEAKAEILKTDAPTSSVPAPSAASGVEETPETKKALTDIEQVMSYIDGKIAEFSK